MGRLDLFSKICYNKAFLNDNFQRNMEMNNDQINTTITDIEYSLNKIKSELSRLENEKKRQDQKQLFELNYKNAQVKNAQIMKKALSYFARGYSTWETAEKIKDEFPSVWDAYYFISSENAQNQARKRYAKQYIVKALYDNGFKMAEIAKIAGYSTQRCGQIIKSGII